MSNNFSDFLALIPQFQQNCNHGNTLQEVVAAIRQQPYEIVALFDKTGIKVFERTDYDAGNVIVGIPPALQKEVAISLHNHVDDATFSMLDLALGPDLELTMNILVTPSYSYYLCRPDSGWPEKTDWLDEFMTLEDNIFIASRRNPSRYEARHEALMKVASHYGIHYYVTNLHGDIVASN